MWTPSDVANQALDMAGIEYTIGDIEENSKPAQVCLRQYGLCLRQLLRAAHWNFARAQLSLTLLADASGQTANVGTQVQVPWIYEYLLPSDCMKLRFIPWQYGNQFVVPVPTGNISIPSTPLTASNTLNPFLNQRLKPARFLIGFDPNFPSQPGEMFAQTEGQSPVGSTVVMTNVQNALAIYTKFMPYPNTWDPLFRGALVAYLASEIALPLAKMSVLGTPAKALEVRSQNIEIAKAKIKEARVADGNEMGFANSDIKVDWMQTRRGRGWGGPGWGGWGWDDGPGCFWGAWDACGFADGSSY